MQTLCVQKQCQVKKASQLGSKSGSIAAKQVYAFALRSRGVFKFEFNTAVLCSMLERVMMLRYIVEYDISCAHAFQFIKINRVRFLARVLVVD